MVDIQTSFVFSLADPIAVGDIPPIITEMDTMTDEEDTIGLIANPQCLADVGLAEAE